MRLHIKNQNQYWLQSKSFIRSGHNGLRKLQNILMSFISVFYQDKELTK